MFEATHIHCPRCRAVRPLRSSPLLRGEPSMGVAAVCAGCGFVVFAVTHTRTVYCQACDAFSVLRLEASVVAGSVFVCCVECGHTLAMVQGAAKAGSGNRT